MARRAEDLKEMRTAEADRLRAAMDADGDGVLTPEEVAEYARDVAVAEVAGALQAAKGLALGEAVRTYLARLSEASLAQVCSLMAPSGRPAAQWTPHALRRWPASRRWCCSTFSPLPPSTSSSWRRPCSAEARSRAGPLAWRRPRKPPPLPPPASAARCTRRCSAPRRASPRPRSRAARCATRWGCAAS